MAEEFLQAATKEPHPIHSAASIAFSASSFLTRMEFATGACPVPTDINPPAAIILSKEERSTIKSFNTGNGQALHGSIVTVSPSLKLRIINWQVVVRANGP